MFIRFILEGYLEIVICAALNLQYLAVSPGGLEWDSAFLIVNNCTLFLLSFAALVFPLWALAFYCKNFAKWRD